MTQTDKKTEETIISFIQSQYPEHMILGEEGGVISSRVGAPGRETEHRPPTPLVPDSPP